MDIIDSNPCKEYDEIQIDEQKKYQNIGIVTWFWGNNFGSMLQAYALQYTINCAGYNSLILNNLVWSMFVPIMPRKVQPFPIRLFRNIIRPIHYSITGRIEKQLSDMSKRTAYFLTNELKVYDALTYRAHKKMLKKFDLYIAGSDQLWNPFCANTENLLDFVGDKKRISYATSMGVSSLPPETISVYKKSLSKFSSISVREKKAKELIESILPNKNVKHVLDPTFLFDDNKWLEFAKDSALEILPKRYVLIYIVGNKDDYPEQINHILDLYNFSIDEAIIVPSNENPNFTLDGIKIVNEVGPHEFIKLLSKAELVCTDSFHGTAISINLSKQFVELLRFNDDDEKSQNSRIYELLDEFDLSSRIYNKNNTEWQTIINYQQIQRKLSFKRKESLLYLFNSIEG